MGQLLEDSNEKIESDIKFCQSNQFSTDIKVKEEYWRSFTIQSVIDYKNNVRIKLINILTNGQLNFNDINTLNVLNISAEYEMLHQDILMHLFVQLPIESLRLNYINEYDFV
ncbi:unnamed protein product [Rotaria sordida]|uniref:Uncharacterized protein n=1 Tax=Rotaria sordida TaxID=392033 RepID=A0A819E2X0_9BILA|nr:unnamed protein product [Rotaria sordida]